MTKKNIILGISILLISLSAFGQRKKNIKYAGFLFYDSYYFNGPLTFHLGGAVPLYSGDACSGLSCNEINPGFLLGASYKFAPGTYAAIDFQYLQMGASTVNDNREIGFSSNNLELTAYVRYNFLKDIILKHYHMDQKPRFIKPYMKLGIGVLQYNPSPTYLVNGTTILDDNISFSSGGYALIIPVGLGVSFNFSNRVSVLLDANYRYCFTDYLDGIGIGGSNDGYLTANLTITYSPWGKRLKPKQRKAPEGTKVPVSGGGGGASPSPSSGGNAAPGAGGTEKDDQIVPEETTPSPEPEEELPYEGYEEPVEEESPEEDEYLDFDESGSEESGEEGGGEEYYDDSGW